MSKRGVEIHLAKLGWTPMEAHLFVKSIDLHVATYGTDMCPGEGILCGSAERPLLNLWTPPTLVPKPGEFPTIRKAIGHLTEEDATSAAWLENWMAAKVQNPASLPKVAVVFSTSQGGGKNFLFRVLAEILGPENCAVIKQQELESRFNKRWIRKLLILGDEVMSNDNVKDVSQLLKVLIDGGHIESEGKNENQVEVQNRMAWMFASNDRITPVALEESDRRYSFFSNFEPVPEEYTRALAACFEPDRTTITDAFREEIAAFAHYLGQLQVDGRAAGTPLVNKSRQALMDANRPSHDTFFEELDENGFDYLVANRNFGAGINDGDKEEWDFGPEGVATKAIYRLYREYCKDSGQYPLRLNKFGAALKNRTPAWRHIRNTTPTNRRVWCYVVPREPKGMR